jgi:electron transfer flavoprotein alpha subunit
MKVLVFIEQRDGKVKGSSREALTTAAKIAGGSANVAGILVGSSDTSVIKGFGADKVYTVEGDNFTNYNPMHYTNAVEAAVSDFGAEAVMGIASPMGRDIFPRLAARLDAGLITDVTDIATDGLSGGIKPMYAGKVLATTNFVGGGLKLVTLRPNCFPAEEVGGAAETASLSVDAADTSLKLVELKKGASEKADLTEASRIISGGRALASKENFSILDECADVLGATVGASRAAVDSGYATHAMQVGQTGKTVNPQLYIACGISGSIQHMAGMRTSKTIVAVNTDPDAPIFSVADYGIVGDLFEVVPALTAKLKETL